MDCLSLLKPKSDTPHTPGGHTANGNEPYLSAGVPDQAKNPPPSQPSRPAHALCLSLSVAVAVALLACLGEAVGVRYGSSD